MNSRANEYEIPMGFNAALFPIIELTGYRIQNPDGI